MSETGDASDNAAELAEALRRSVSVFVRTVRQKTGTVKSAQSETLELLDNIGPVNVATLAKQRGVTHQTMRLVIAGLEAEGSVRQLADSGDRRSRLVSITAEGQRALSRGKAARARHIEEAIRSLLSPDERKQLKAGIHVLARLAGNSR